jgi:uncharacterized phiE125 gp8 family phage protein
MIQKEKPLHTLIHLEEFKLILGIDDRDNKLSCFSLVTATHTIEQYCKRRLRIKTFHQSFTAWYDSSLFLQEYPVKEVLSITLIQKKYSLKMLEPKFYRYEPSDEWENIPCEITLSPAVNQFRDVVELRVMYKAGYQLDEVPADLKSACLELAAWNFNRYKSKRIGIINNEKSSSNNVSFEMSMPENVKTLLEAYRRKTI